MSEFVEHTERVPTLIPFYSRRIPTAMYWMSQERYGEFFQKDEKLDGNAMRWENFHTRKQTLQKVYQRRMEAQGVILREIFCKRAAQDGSRAFEYLKWLAVQYAAYHSYLEDGMEDEGFLKFVQTDLSQNEDKNVV